MRGVALLVGVLALGMTWYWRQGAEDRALVELPPGERQVAYAHELAAFQTLCGGTREEGLAERCQERAVFILKFPECDSPCRRFARGQFPEPGR